MDAAVNSVAVLVEEVLLCGRLIRAGLLLSKFCSSFTFVSLEHVGSS